MSKDSKGGGKDKPQRVVPEHRGGPRLNSGGAREGAGRKERRRGGYKTRNWVTVLYPESAVKGWKDILRGWCCQALLSPLHDKDKDPTGEPKKPHYHLLVMFDGPRSQSLMEEKFKELGGVGCQACNSARGYARYLCHMDNPEKYQYPVEQVEAFGGANYLDIIALESDRRVTIAEMCGWCRAEGCISFAALCDYAAANRPTWWQAITSNSTMIMFRYIRSLEDEMNKGQFRKPISPEEEQALKEQDKARLEALKPKQRPLTPLEQARMEARDARDRLQSAFDHVLHEMYGREADTMSDEKFMGLYLAFCKDLPGGGRFIVPEYPQEGGGDNGATD